LSPIGWIGCVHCEKIRHNFVAWTNALIAPFRPVLHQSSCSNKTVQNAPKHQFGVQWGGSGAFVAKRANATSLHRQMHRTHRFSLFFTEVGAVKKRFEMPQNLSLSPIRWIGCVCCEKFWHDFVARTCVLIDPIRHVLYWSLWSNKTVRNALKHEFGVQWGRSGYVRCEKFWRDFVARTCEVRNARKHEFDWVDWVRSLWQIPTWLCCTN
jgi:hypothetical protein